MSEVDISVVSTETQIVKSIEEKDYWPGKINYVTDKGHYPGATCIGFNITSASDLAATIDQFFKDNQGMLLLDVKPTSYGVLVFYTRVVEREQLEQFQRIQKVTQKFIDEENERLAKEKEEAYLAATKDQREAKQKAEERLKELERLAEYGTIHLNNCGKKKKHG